MTKQNKREMKEEQLKLTKEQRRRLNSIRWLFSESKRREGRSTLLALAYIAEALEGRTVKIIDHAFITTGAGYRANKMLADRIWEIVRKDEIPLKITWPTLELSLLTK